jgi:hypothetical protein
MSRATFGDAPEVGRALVGYDAICVSFITGASGYPNVIAHELGHLANNGVDDFPGCSAMCSGGGGTPAPNDNECSAVNTWATTKSVFFSR